MLPSSYTTASSSSAASLYRLQTLGAGDLYKLEKSTLLEIRNRKARFTLAAGKECARLHTNKKKHSPVLTVARGEDRKLINQAAIGLQVALGWDLSAPPPI
jgi:hypothetical protein